MLLTRRQLKQDRVVDDTEDDEGSTILPLPLWAMLLIALFFTPGL
jgi:hypothetical protein